jgi:hypothetical protein
MPTRDRPLMVRNLRGLNRRDGGERVLDNQFYRLQNWYQPVKGKLYKTWGTTDDVTAAQIPGCNKITGLHRHYNQNREKFTVYHCEPNSTNPPDATSDLTLAEIAGGNLFNGAAVVAMRFCYSWFGWGVESTYNSKNRGGFVANTNAWLNPGHQSITVSTNAKGVRVTVPAFPTGAKGAHIFAARGTATEMTYMGTVTTSGGTLDVLNFIGPIAAANDALGVVTLGGSIGAGTLSPGTYYVSLAWVTDASVVEGGNLPGNFTQLKPSTAVVLSPGQNTLTVGHSLATSTNGAKACYVFLGTQPANTHAMVCVGMATQGSSLIVTSIPNHSAQSHPDIQGVAAADGGSFDQSVRSANVVPTDRYGFLVKKGASGVLSEVMPSRTLNNMIAGAGTPLGYYSGVIRTANDKSNFGAGGQPTAWGAPIYEPCFAFYNPNSLSYFVNGVDTAWQTDGYTLGQIAPEKVAGTTTPLPPPARFIMTFKDQLVMSGAQSRNLVYGSNAYKPNNFAAGGTGTNARFLTIGAATGDDVSAIGIFSYSPDANNDPRTFLVGMKKNSAWMKDSFPDPVGGIGSPLEQLSGRVGTTAYRTLVQTKLGLIFLGSDGDVYLARGNGEPRSIGSSIKPLLEHLPASDALLQKCTAVFHDNHYKLSYPSSSGSTYNDAQLWADLRIEDGSPIDWVGPHTGISVGAQVVLVGDSDDFSRLAVLGDQSGSVKLDDTSTLQHRGVTITSVGETKTYKFLAEMHLKRIMGAVFDCLYDTAYAHELLVEYFSDDKYDQVDKILSSGGATWDASSFDAGLFTDAIESAVPAMLGENNLIGRTLRMRFTHANNAQFIISAFGILTQPERRQIV